MIQAGTVCAGDWRPEDVGPGDDISGAQRHLEGHELEKMEARVAE